MIRKFLCYLILVAITIHCSSRLGILSYLFEKRHAIAYSMGMIAEIPIVLCNADYDFSNNLKIQDSDSDQGVPYLALAQEMNLFLVSILEFNQSSSRWTAQEPQSFYLEFSYHSPARSIFHPPSIA